jgi:hypothetical protein
VTGKVGANGGSGIGDTDDAVNDVFVSPTPTGEQDA